MSGSTTSTGDDSENVRWEIREDVPDAILRDAWDRDPVRNPFMAPCYTRVMIDTAKSAGLKAAIAVGRASDESTRGIWPLAMDATGRLRFVHHVLYDQLTAIAAGDFDAVQFGAGLIAGIKATKPNRVIFHDVAPWGPTVAACGHAFGQLGWAHREFAATPCPLVRADSGKALLTALKDHSPLRRAVNRLKKESQFSLEVLDDDSDMAVWCQEFTDAHLRRWGQTDSPSQYENADIKNVFPHVMQAWQTDGLLIRSALRIGGERMAFAASLAMGDRLMYHHVAVGPAGQSLRAGTVLLYLTGLWAAEHGYRVFDLGSGRESYKKRVANDSEPLWRIYGTPSRLSRTYVGALLEERVRKSPRLERFWDRISSGRLRTRLRRLLRGK